MGKCRYVAPWLGLILVSVAVARGYPTSSASPCLDRAICDHVTTEDMGKGQPIRIRRGISPRKVCVLDDASRQTVCGTVVLQVEPQFTEIDDLKRADTRPFSDPATSRHDVYGSGPPVVPPPSYPVPAPQPPAPHVYPPPPAPAPHVYPPPPPPPPAPSQYPPAPPPNRTPTRIVQTIVFRNSDSQESIQADPNSEHKSTTGTSKTSTMERAADSQNDAGVQQSQPGRALNLDPVSIASQLVSQVAGATIKPGSAPMKINCDVNTLTPIPGVNVGDIISNPQFLSNLSSTVQQALTQSISDASALNITPVKLVDLSPPSPPPPTATYQPPAFRASENNEGESPSQDLPKLLSRLEAAARQDNNLKLHLEKLAATFENSQNSLTKAQTSQQRNAFSTHSDNPSLSPGTGDTLYAGTLGQTNLDVPAERSAEGDYRYGGYGAYGGYPSRYGGMSGYMNRPYMGGMGHRGMGMGYGGMGTMFRDNDDVKKPTDE